LLRRASTHVMWGHEKHNTQEDMGMPLPTSLRYVYYPLLYATSAQVLALGVALAHVHAPRGRDSIP
jgi:hypothetical protein